MKWGIVAICCVTVPVAAQQEAVVPAPTMAESWWAIIGMGLVLLLAWSITRWVAKPILAQLEAPDEATQPDRVLESAPGPDLAQPLSEPDMRLVSGDLALDLVARRARIADNEVTLTSTEFDLLRFFLTHEGQALTRADLLREVWGHQQPIYSRTV
ncbi:MAG: winged helix-turn-helix transcriptional regulator, partial [Gemmatimonadetes bacterium]|nr:winged helix-turn-helix transcriptional regulator [Gemmatimonadota bacterium]